MAEGRAEWDAFLERNKLLVVWENGLPWPGSTYEHARKLLIDPAEKKIKEQEESVSTDQVLKAITTHVDELKLLQEAHAIATDNQNLINNYERECEESCSAPVIRTVTLPGSPRPLPVATTLDRTRFYLGHGSGDPIFSYKHVPNAQDFRQCFTYQGNVPYSWTVDKCRMRVSAVKVINILNIFIHFHANGPAAVFPLRGLVMVRSSRIDKRHMAKLQQKWETAVRLKPLPEEYTDMLRRHDLLQEFITLLFRLDAGQDQRTSVTVEALQPIVEILRSLESPVNNPIPILQRFVNRYFENEAARARNKLFREHDYQHVLVYKDSCLDGRPPVERRRYSIFDHYGQCNGDYIKGKPIFGWGVRQIEWTDNPYPFVTLPRDILEARDRILRELALPTPAAFAEAETEAEAAATEAFRKRSIEEIESPACNPKALSYDEACEILFPSTNQDDFTRELTRPLRSPLRRTEPRRSSPAQKIQDHTTRTRMATLATLRGLRPSLVATPLSPYVRDITIRGLFTSAPLAARKASGGGGQQTPEHVTRMRNLKQHLFGRAPPPLRMARNRHLRHWTVHRAWLLLQRQQREARERELYRMHQSMWNANEELRNTSGPGTRDEGWLYRVAQEKKGVYGPEAVPIEYARYQTETPARQAWNHDWKP